uniref:Uncharacterized protein n=1 Tax=Ditylum brightwellii TaxID=49249 RepID=A0A7S2EJ74_9STRA|mmetsp:Transcript_3260/g.4943  ORF Transcript_3260/g.4943 Transcript_3260/m.4943 type:complete len:574 (+) Transcript_3260:53-1774(+)
MKVFRVYEYNKDLPPTPTQQQNDNENNEKNSSIHAAAYSYREYSISSSSTSSSSSSFQETTRKIKKQQPQASFFLSSFLAKVHQIPKRIFMDLFLPVGYPTSVGKSYLTYQFYDSLQGLCSYLRGVVSTSAVLTAAGVGDGDATAIGAAMTWAMRDGLGMIGGLFFSYITSCHFDSYVKEFRLFADVINDVGLTLDMLAPYIAASYGKKCILFVSAMGQLCRVACGMAAGATKGSITQHFAIRGNMADLNAKESTQETLVSLVGMILGIVLAKYLHYLESGGSDDDSSLDGRHAAAVVSWSIFIILTIVHVWANYAGVKLLRLKTLNRERAKVAFDNLFNECKKQCIETVYNSKRNCGDIDESMLEKTRGDNNKVLKTICRPDEVNESLVLSTFDLLFPTNVRLGVRLNESQHGLSNDDLLHYFQDEYASENYILTLVPSSSIGSGIRRRIWGSSSCFTNVCVTLRLGASDRDELKAFIHAMIARKCLDEIDLTRSIDGRDIDITKGIGQKRLIHITHKCVNNLFGEGLNEQESSNSYRFSLEKLSKLGWDVDHRLYIGFGPWRAQWGDSKVN